MLQFIVRNYRKISSADIDLSKLTLIGGKNGAGKTSLIDAIRSVATGEANPFRAEITKKEISMLVRSGSPSAYAEIKDGEILARIDWPKCNYSTKGKPPRLSFVAMGIDSLVDMKVVDRINYIVEMMDAAPKDTDLITELKNTSIFNAGDTIGTSDLFKRLWEEISANGWDNAYKLAREKGVKYKNLWEDTTGSKTYGVRIAENWTPEIWDPALEKSKEVDLIAEVNKNKEWLEAAIKETAISDHEVDRLTAIANQLDPIKKKLSTIQQKQDVVEKTMNQKRSRIREITAGAETRGLLCPKCNVRLTLSNNELKVIPEAEYKRAGKNKAEISQIEKDIESLDAQNKELIQEFGAERSALIAAETAYQKLQNISIQKEGLDAAKVQDVRNKLEVAESRLAAFKQYKKAHELARAVILNKELCDILAPAGLRNKKLTKAIEKLNKSMKMLSDSVGWDPVEITGDCNILVAGVPYGRLIAKSERYRARVMLQLMVCMAEKSQFVIVDDTDELTKSVRNQLMKVILQSKIQAVVVSAMDDKSEMPDLSSINGRTYWIKEGKVA